MSSERQGRSNDLPSDTAEDAEELQVSEVAFAEPMVDHHATHFDHTENYLESISLLRNEIQKREKIIRLKREELTQTSSSEKPRDDGVSSVNTENLEGSKKDDQQKNDENKIKYETIRHEVRTYLVMRRGSVIDLTGETSEKESPKASEDDDDVCTVD